MFSSGTSHTRCRSRISRSFKTITSTSCFSKTKSFFLNIDSIRSPNSIGNWWVTSGTIPSLGQIPSNVWEMAIPTQGSWGNGHMDHFCPLPPEMAKRVILLSTNEGGLVFDPFAGTGTTVLAAEELGRPWLALDVNHKYREMFYRRLAHEKQSGNGPSSNGHISLAETNLKLRQLKFAIQFIQADVAKPPFDFQRATYHHPHIGAKSESYTTLGHAVSIDFGLRQELGFRVSNVQ